MDGKDGKLLSNVTEQPAACKRGMLLSMAAFISILPIHIRGKNYPKNTCFSQVIRFKWDRFANPEKTELQQQIIDKNRIISKRGLI